MLGRLFCVLLLAASAWAQTFSATPIDDLNTGNYLGFEGGLYENGSNRVPQDHNADGAALSHLSPINGKIVLLSIGMSNAADTFIPFIQQSERNSNVNHTNLAILNGAQKDAVACYWTAAFGPPTQCPNGQSVMNEFDRVKQTVLSKQHITESQVQAVWLYNANPDPTTSLPSTKADAYALEGYMGQVLRAARIRYPNLKLVFIASREYAGYAVTPLNPEPYAYEAGFAMKWLIQAQINQIRTGQIDPIAGDLNYNTGVAPWIVWAAYTWTNADSPRGDGFYWCDGQTTSPCNGEVDVKPDGTHPNNVGSAKLAGLQLNYFLGSPYAPWFRASGK